MIVQTPLHDIFVKHRCCTIYHPIYIFRQSSSVSKKFWHISYHDNIGRNMQSMQFIPHLIMSNKYRIRMWITCFFCQFFQYLYQNISYCPKSRKCNMHSYHIIVKNLKSKVYLPVTITTIFSLF